jgi:hypothetical protein
VSLCAHISRSIDPSFLVSHSYSYSDWDGRVDLDGDISYAGSTGSEFPGNTSDDDDDDDDHDDEDPDEVN